MVEIGLFIVLCIFVLSLIGLPFFIVFYRKFNKEMTENVGEYDSKIGGYIKKESGGEFIDTKTGKPLTENQFQDKMKEFQDILNEEDEEVDSIIKKMKDDEDDEDEDLGQKDKNSWSSQLTDEEKESIKLSLMDKKEMLKYTDEEKERLKLISMSKEEMLEYFLNGDKDGDKD